MDCYGYCRVSGKAQVDKSGLQRQERVIYDFARIHKMKVANIYLEKGVSGTLQDRPALTKMLLDLEAGIVKTILIEKVDRLARDLMVQESIIRTLKRDKYKLISVHEGSGLLSNDPSRKLIRQILGAFSEAEKSLLVQKLRISRERMRKLKGKCEGRKSYKEKNPDLVKVVRNLRKRKGNAKLMSYEKIAIWLQEHDYKSISGKIWTAQMVYRICNA